MAGTLGILHADNSLTFHPDNLRSKIVIIGKVYQI